MDQPMTIGLTTKDMDRIIAEERQYAENGEFDTSGVLHVVKRLIDENNKKTVAVFAVIQTHLDKLRSDVGNVR
jgi:hypothetical protein